jgi:cysteine desulfurase
MRDIYLDNNATTPLLAPVWEAMRAFLGPEPGNPASAHKFGRRARQAVEDSRELIAELLGAGRDEVVFTAGATEANNLAVFGLTGSEPAHIVASPIEHPSVLEPLEQLRQRGWCIGWLPVAPTGSIDPVAFQNAVRQDTRLVAMMLANHETGAMQPVQALAASLEPSVHWHCDAVQAVGKVPVNFHELGAATLVLSGHKFHGPAGIGALLVRRGIKIAPHLWGGPQQRGLRPGTEPVPLIVGMAKALELAHRELASRLEKVKQLRATFLSALRQHVSPVTLNGPEEDGLPHTLNLSFPGCRSESLLMNLDLAGVACSAGSACSSGSLLASPVLRAMGLADTDLHSAIRFSFSALLEEEEANEAAERIAAVVIRLRSSAEPLHQ